MSSSVRVLQLAKHFDPDTGGIETVTLNISDMLLRHGIQADVLCTEVGGHYEERERPYRVIRCKSDLAFGNKRISWQYLRKGRQLEREYDCAIVHVPNPLAVLAALSWRKPVIILWHADIPQAPIRWAATPLDNRLLYKAAAVIGATPVHLTCSRRAAAIDGRGVVIPFPFDPSRMPAPTGTSGFAEKLRSFRRGRALSISVGRLVPYKGFDVLIEAARNFDDRLAALIVGSGPLEQELAKQIQAAGVADRVLLAGSLSPYELADAFDQARLGCMPSVTAAEMYGLAQVESMAAGLPVVSTRLERSGVPYVNRDGETGLLVEPGNAEELASAMLRLVDDVALWERLSEGARRAVAEEFDLDRVSERYAQLIRQVAPG